MSQSPYNSSQPIVGIVMGSDSDWSVMEAAAEVLDEFGIPYEADVVSAHRMPEDMIEYGKKAHSRGIRVIIAGAGGRSPARYARFRDRSARDWCSGTSEEPRGHGLTAVDCSDARRCSGSYRLH